MERELLILWLGGAPAGEGYLQRIAGEALWSDVPIHGPPRRGACPRAIPEVAVPDWRLVYDGPGWVDGRTERVVSRIAAGGERRIDFEDGESYEVVASGSLVRRIAGRTSSESARIRALGAPLALALAMRGTFLLHASAVRVGEGAVALTAPSGGGKSTLAAHASRRGFLRLVDDQLPVRLDEPVRVLPDFPQPKLGSTEAPPEAAATPVQLQALIEIAHSPETSAISATRLAPAAATLALVRATVAARLFDEVLLGAHFAACAGAAATLPVYRIEYPSGVHHLDEVVDALKRTVERAGR